MDLIRFIRDQCMSSSSPSFPIPAENSASLSLSISLFLSLCPSVSEAGVRYSFLVYDTISKGIEKREVEEVVCQASAEKSG